MVASAAFFIAPAQAQWQTPTNSVPVGRGSGTGFNSAGPGTNNQTFMGNTGAAPSFRSLTGSDLPTNGVTNSNLAQMAAGTVKCNNTGSTANAADCSGTSWFDQAYCNTMGYVIARFTSAWTCSNNIPVNARWLGATGNGSTDDTTAMQLAFTTAASSGACVYVPFGSYKITVSLTGALRCLTGDGYPGYGGTVYTSNSTQTTGFLSSTIVCSLTINCIALTSNLAFDIERIQIQYPSTVAGAGVSGLTLSAVSGATNVNSGTMIKDVMISGADNALQLNNIYEFKIDNLKSVSSWVSGLTISSPNYKSNGDSTITNSTFWGNGVAGYLYHVGINSGGGMRIVNNKFNFGHATATSCIILQPNLVVQQSEEPNVIANNSMEACAVGINFNNGNVANADISQTTITGNQIWAGIAAIFVNSNGVGQWINGLVVSGNFLQIVGGAAKTVNTLDNINDLRWGNNTIECSGGCTGNSIGVAIAAHVTNSVLGADTFGSSIPFHYTSTSSIVIDDPSGMLFANLPASAANGSRIFVTNGTPASTPCTGASTGSTAFRQNSAWKCF